MSTNQLGLSFALAASPDRLVSMVFVEAMSDILVCLVLTNQAQSRLSWHVRHSRVPLCLYVAGHAVQRHVCLLGHIDADTREWTDGVLTAAARAVAKEPLEQRSWVVCDGDVDPEWIESLNSVLDDNRQDLRAKHVNGMLTDTTELPHSDQVASNNVAVLFWTGSLSRCIHFDTCSDNISRTLASHTL